jgi:hypothetical protein
MVNAFGYYASAKGMVLVPNLSELSSAAAVSLLESSGLGYLIGADVNTTNQALDNLVASQTPSSNTLVDYGSVVSFSLYNFVPAPPFFPFFPSFTPPSLPTPSLVYVEQGNAAGGLRYYKVELRNLNAYDSYSSVTFSPAWDSFESTYPEYIREVSGAGGTFTFEVTASAPGYSSATGSVTVVVDPVPSQSPFFPFFPSFQPEAPYFPPFFRGSVGGPF